MTITKADSYIITTEPGDSTMYKFIIIFGIESGNVFIASAGSDCPLFHGYSYSISSILAFFQKVGIPPLNKDKYHTWVSEVLRKDTKYFLKYIAQHSLNNNACTNLAALVAVNKCLLRKSLEQEF